MTSDKRTTALRRVAEINRGCNHEDCEHIHVGTRIHLDDLVYLSATLATALADCERLEAETQRVPDERAQIESTCMLDGECGHKHTSTCFTKEQNMRLRQLRVNEAVLLRTEDHRSALMRERDALRQHVERLRAVLHEAEMLLRKSHAALDHMEQYSTADENAVDWPAFRRLMKELSRWIEVRAAPKDTAP